MYIHFETKILQHIRKICLLILVTVTEVNYANVILTEIIIPRSIMGLSRYIYTLFVNN